MVRFVWIGCAALLLACASKGPAGVSPDGAAPPAVDAVAGGSPDAPAVPTSCRTIRICIYACGKDSACAAGCVSSAPGPARQQYNDAHSCSVQACPNQDDISCRCSQECIDGSCVPMFDDCDQGASDPFCDMECH
jgi:hypothetical protein